jgi:hypothetical protein
MSSTELDTRRRQAGKFFDRYLLPLAARRGAACYFPLGPDASLGSYYQDRARRAMGREDFERGGFSTPAALARELRDLWQSQGDSSLAGLAQPMGQLAEDLRLSESQTAEVSELIYVMF